MGVSKNRGGPAKSSILIGFSIINHPYIIIYSIMYSQHQIFKHVGWLCKCKTFLISNRQIDLSCEPEESFLLLKTGEPSWALRGSLIGSHRVSDVHDPCGMRYKYVLDRTELHQAGWKAISCCVEPKRYCYIEPKSVGAYLCHQFSRSSTV